VSGKHAFVGFGFGPIQAGLFAAEARAGGNFGAITVAEIDAALADAVRANADAYVVNVAHADRIEAVEVRGVRLVNPRVGREREALVEALARATEAATCLPSVAFFESGGISSVADLLAEGLRGRGEDRPMLVYAAENNNHAAEILEAAVRRRLPAPPRGAAFVNTVIGKMSRVVADRAEMEALALKPVAPGLERAFLVEAFNRILVSRHNLAGFTPGIGAFEEKPDLLPFEEAKLYGHNAVHALLAFLGARRGLTHMRQLREHPDLLDVGRRAFIDESGGALVGKYAGLGDPLFTAPGYRAYAEDLLARMTNPHLADTVARAARDPLRKLGRDDRIFGTMRLALARGIRPANMARGAAAALELVLAEAEAHGIPAALRAPPAGRFTADYARGLLTWLWGAPPASEDKPILDLLCAAQGPERAIRRPRSRAGAGA